MYSSDSMLRDLKAIRYAYESLKDKYKVSPIDKIMANKYQNLFKED